MTLPRMWIAIAVALAGATLGCKKTPAWERGRKVLHYPIRGKIDSFDPVRASSQYTGLAQAQVYEPLYTYEYLHRPLRLRPLLAAAMPHVSEDQRTYTIELKQGVRFHDDPCFVATGGKGRELVAQDVVYSFKRMADRTLSPSGWWNYQDRIVGFDPFKERMDARPPGAPFDWDAPVEGMRAVDRYRLELVLERPFPQFLYVLATSYAAVVPRECAEHYGPEFASHPVGTGPFRMSSWTRGSRIVYQRNPTYRDDRYPTKASPEMVERGLLAPAGQRVPFLDALVLHVFEQDQPMWLKFRVGDLDIVQVPSEYQDVLFDDNKQLRPHIADSGIRSYNLALLDFIYHGFNMEDPLVGQGERAKLVRQAVSLALDTKEINNTFYNGHSVLYDGPIPPGLDGYEPGVLSPYRGPNHAKARALLARAGYPDGQGLPPLRLETSNSGFLVEQSELVTRQLKAVGIELEVTFNSFPELSQKIKRKKAQMFNLAWVADYPDAENFLQLFYGPNEAPGSNNFNYKSAEYDRLYDQSRIMQPGPERTAIYQRMRNLVIEDAPAVGSMGRTRFYVWHDRVKNIVPDETWFDWLKYLDLDVREEH